MCMCVCACVNVQVEWNTVHGCCVHVYSVRYCAWGQALPTIAFCRAFSLFSNSFLECCSSETLLRRRVFSFKTSKYCVLLCSMLPWWYTSGHSTE